MRVAVLGTRGIPNNYGGFEQCAEKVGRYLVEAGCEVTVYNPADHPFREERWGKIGIRRIFSHEKGLRFFNTFLYDYLGLKDAVERDFHIILELGYSPCSLFYYLKKRTGARIVTNMDGLDWQRGKWNLPARKLLEYSEKLAVRHSHALVADNPGIKDYLGEKYGVESCYIPYGAELFDSPDQAVLPDYRLEKYAYYMVIARMEPENNIETIADGYIRSGAEEPLVLVGALSTRYGRFLEKKYRNCPGIRFPGGIYDFRELSTLRWYARLYFHGHSVGGTNPSLLEAMASNACIAAHDNVFNRYVLGEGGFYFSDARQVAELIAGYRHSCREKFVGHNRKRVGQEFSWQGVARSYLELFRDLLSPSPLSKTGRLS